MLVLASLLICPRNFATAACVSGGASTTSWPVRSSASIRAALDQTFGVMRCLIRSVNSANVAGHAVRASAGTDFSPAPAGADDTMSPTV